MGWYRKIEKKVAFYNHESEYSQASRRIRTGLARTMFVSFGFSAGSVLLSLFTKLPFTYEIGMVSTGLYGVLGAILIKMSKKDEAREKGRQRDLFQD